MQTFLPYADFAQSAKSLDPSRLGNQAYRECKTLIGGGWKNHPAAKMWLGYESALARYALACFEELSARGRHYSTHIEHFTTLVVDDRLPPWLGDERLHSSHRAALLCKDAVWYSQFGWSESAAVRNEKGSLPYFWPVS